MEVEETLDFGTLEGHEEKFVEEDTCPCTLSLILGSNWESTCLIGCLSSTTERGSCTNPVRVPLISIGFEEELGDAPSIEIDYEDSLKSILI